MEAGAAQKAVIHAGNLPRPRPHQIAGSLRRVQRHPDRAVEVELLHCVDRERARPEDLAMPGRVAWL